MSQSFLVIIILLFTISSTQSFQLSYSKLYAQNHAIHSKFPQLFESIHDRNSNTVTTDELIESSQNNTIQILQSEQINPRKISWKASAKASVKVKEIKRTTEEYMALPASQYSVLSADQVTRLSDTEFRYALGNLNFFGTNINTVLYVDVNVHPNDSKSEIIVSRAEISGSEIAKRINGSFSVNAVNIVSTGTDKKGNKILQSDSKLKVDVIVPPSPFPLRVIQSSGNFIMQSTLSLLVATFVRILAADFARWSAGNNKRDAVDGANLST